MLFICCIVFFLPFEIQGRHINCDEGCMRNNECQPAGSTYTRNCYTYKCVVTKHENSTVTSRFVVESAHCRRKGQCMPEGSTYSQNCNIFKCKIIKSSDGSYHRRFAIDSIECRKDGKCYPDGYIYEIKERCAKLKCKTEKKANSWTRKFETIDFGCHDFNGACVANNTVFQKDCNDYVCIVSKIRNSMYSQIKLKQFRCHSNDDECIDPGSDIFFRKQIKNKMYSKCKCRFRGTKGYHIVCWG